MVNDVRFGDADAVFTIRSAAAAATCSICLVEARRVHNRYVRSLADLPMDGRAARMRVAARRFRRDEALKR